GERGAMLASIERILEYHREAMKEQSHDSLFAELGTSVSDIVLPPAAQVPLETRLVWEKELLGLYVSGHPLDRFKEKLSKRPMTLGQLKRDLVPGMMVVAAGMVEDVRTILTKGGDQMAFVKISDFDGSIEAAIFPRIYKEFHEILKPESVIALKGRLSNRNGEISMVADKLKAL
ncbi:MAG TPA: OB-fold nucleic acid binding domain-containing protein, partial [Candidatus Paceibacterota bacterium]|nr:OB-fold nucleic acid binding domain-containing protein [Candidatus Paceibacterota bacterium]